MTFFGYDGADIPRCGNSPRSRALSAPVSRSAARSASSRAHSCGRRRLVRSALAALLLGCSASVLPGVVLAQRGFGEFEAQGIESTTDIVEMGEEASQGSELGVFLSLEPSINHTVMVTNSDPGAVTVSPGSLTFTMSNFDAAQLFIITPVQDADTNDESVTLTLSGDELTSKTVTVKVRDDDRELVLTPSAVTVTEGGTATFTVKLASLPGRDTTTVSIRDTGAATVNRPALTFTPMTWDTAQPVTVTGVQDTDTSDEHVTIILSGDGVVTGTVTVDVTDNDTPGPSPPDVTPGDGTLVVSWAAVDNATGYKVQWKSGGQGYNTADRQATVTPGSTTSHTITGLTNGTEYSVRVIATRTDANDSLPSASVQGTPAVPTAAGVITVSKTALTVTEAETPGDSYTVVLDSRPTADVTVTVAGHSGTDVTPDPGTLTFTTSNWDTVQTVTVTAVDDADTTDDSVTLTHSAASTDTGYSGITIAGVVVTVRDNDTAQVTGVTVDAGDAQLVVNWTAVDNATGYTVQWKSGGQGYDTDDRQAPVTPGSTTSHTIEGLANGTEYTVRVIATRTGTNDGPPSAEVTGTTEMTPTPTPPTPTPTLPEIALLLLAMLLLGSGVYLLRGRQSGGLTHT